MFIQWTIHDLFHIHRSVFELCIPFFQFMHSSKQLEFLQWNWKIVITSYIYIYQFSFHFSTVRFMSNLNVVNVYCQAFNVWVDVQIRTAYGSLVFSSNIIQAFSIIHIASNQCYVHLETFQSYQIEIDKQWLFMFLIFDDILVFTAFYRFAGINIIVISTMHQINNISKPKPTPHFQHQL